MQTCILHALKSVKTFESFVSCMSVSSTNLKHLKNKTKIVGDAWEDFCCLYLQKIKGWTAKRLNEWDASFLRQFHLKQRDVGIDLIAIDEHGNHIAVQCKYRKNFQKLSWRDVSTFDALCMRTGPWTQRIVMTTSKSLHREGKVQVEDVFWGKSHFESLERHDWCKLAGLGEGRTCGNSSHTSDPLEVREARLRYFLNR